MELPHIIDSKKDGPIVLITAGVHGDEYEPIIAAQQLIGLLANKLIVGKVLIIPCVNSTAVELHTRYGDDGLDLARVCPGNPNGSSTERDAAEISELIKHSDYLIDLHTGGRILDIFPMAGYMLHTSEVVLAKQREMAKAFGLPMIWGTEDSPNGRTLSVARDAMVPAIYVEYGGGSTVRQEIIQSYTAGCLALLTYLKMIDDEVKETTSPKYWVEDPTPQNGHLQSKMPSPIDGIFVPNKSVGDDINEGELVGQIIDMQSGNKIPIYAQETGIILFLRCDAVVKKGDSLGGIVPVNGMFQYKIYD
jgi:predicted deacylase